MKSFKEREFVFTMSLKKYPFLKKRRISCRDTSHDFGEKKRKRNMAHYYVLYGIYEIFNRSLSEFKGKGWI